MSRRLPSTDLYFNHACADLVRRWWRRGAVTALGANCFICGDTLVLIRQDEDALMSRALDWPGRMIYLIDDDIAAAAENPYLPVAYRNRLNAFDRRYHRNLVERADILLVSSAPLANRFANDAAVTGDIRRVEPVWPFPLPDQRHFADLSRREPLRVIHLGSGSHAGALAALAPAVARLLVRHADMEFSYFGRQSIDPALARHPRVHRIAPMTWPRYRAWLTRQRFHIGLYPLDATDFDRARSGNKLIEHGIIGAVGVYPEDWAPAAMLGEGAVLAPADPAEWEATLDETVARRSELACRAGKAVEIVRRYNAPETQRRLWSGMLGIGIDQRRG